MMTDSWPCWGRMPLPSIPICPSQEPWWKLRSMLTGTGERSTSRAQNFRFVSDLVEFAEFIFMKVETRRRRQKISTALTAF